jgi:hypothetical protein
MLPMPYILKKQRVVTYRKNGIPAVILEGKWLTKLYRINVGDVIDIDHKWPHEIRIMKNKKLSKVRQTKLKEREELRKQYLQKLKNNHDYPSKN